MLLIILLVVFVVCLYLQYATVRPRSYGRLHFPENKEDIVAVEVRTETWRRSVTCSIAFFTIFTLWYAGMYLVYPAIPMTVIVKPDPGDDLWYYDWSKLDPAPELKFSRCYGNQQCARLAVPLDWNSTDPNGPIAAIAVIKEPAPVNVTDPRYGGAILTNPGGPGGSGVMFHIGSAGPLRYILDSPPDPEDDSKEEKYYDLMSFDPRGIQFTTPRARGLDDTIVRSTWASDNLAIGSSLKDKETYDKVWARSTLYGSMLAARVSKESNSSQARGSFVTTAIVVRDMVEIIEAHGRWREAETVRLMNPKSDTDMKKALEVAAYTPGEEKLNYWGISYGTVIGQTFATLQPHRIGRVLLDGVVDAQEFVDTVFLKNLVDIDSITRMFAEICIGAGPECPIAHWAGSRGDPTRLISKMQSTVENLKEDPITFYGGSGDNIYPQVVSYTLVLSILFQLWYAPDFGFRAAATMLKEIEERDLESMFPIIPPLSCYACQFGDSPDPVAPTVNVLCSDSKGIQNVTNEGYLKWVHDLQKQSPFFSDVWAPNAMPCHGFKPPQPEDHDVWRYPGPFGAKTANPILFADQRYDPVTPLRNAKYAAEHLFPGAGVLEITNGAGHSTLAWPSKCAMKAIQRYFVTGDVGGDKKYIECQGDLHTFSNGAEASTMSEDEIEMVQVHRALSKTWRNMGFGLGHRFDRSWSELHQIMRVKESQ